MSSFRSDEFRPRPGFQKSETSGAEVTIYTKGGDPVVLTDAATLLLDGRRILDPNPSIVSVQTHKGFGAAGSWSVTLKPSRVTDIILAQIVDDDWVDIVFKRHGLRYHVMRGLVEDIRRSRTIAGDASVTTYTISGKDFQSVWEKTPIYFNRYTTENLEGEASLKVMSAINISQDVVTTVGAMLYGFLQELGGVGRANWTLPGTMPNRGDNFITTVVFDPELWTDTPPRMAVSPNLMQPSGTAWSLAQEWSDPFFCELFTDTLPSTGQLSAPEDGASLDIPDTAMVAVLRNRPFPNLEEQQDSLWFQLPLFIVPRESIAADDIGRSGAERYNAFYVGPQLVQELMGTGGPDMALPLWNAEDILQHGLRRFDVSSKYVSSNADLLTMTAAQRTLIRDWYCMNPYLLNGNIQLGHGRPDIRMGCRLRVPGYATPASEQSAGQDETYYIEQVSHVWNFGPGLRTSLGVTRGWIGTDDSYLDKLGLVAGNYA